MDQPQSWLINNSCSNRPFSHVLFVFPIQIDPFFCSLKRVHAGIFMLACALFNEQDKEQILLSIIAWFVLGKQNVQAKKVYWPGPKMIEMRTFSLVSSKSDHGALSTCPSLVTPSFGLHRPPSHHVSSIIASEFNHSLQASSCRGLQFRSMCIYLNLSQLFLQFTQ